MLISHFQTSGHAVSLVRFSQSILSRSLQRLSSSSPLLSSDEPKVQLTPSCTPSKHVLNIKPRNILNENVNFLRNWQLGRSLGDGDFVSLKGCENASKWAKDCLDQSEFTSSEKVKLHPKDFI